jgi:hypothetical protein
MRRHRALSTTPALVMASCSTRTAERASREVGADDDDVLQRVPAMARVDYTAAALPAKR